MVHSRVRARGNEIFWLLPSLPLAVLTVLMRGYPTTNSDTGIFLSVAGRLLDGDRLYRDVFDNKDPLFYFSQSLALWAGGWRGPFLIDIVWLTVAGMSTHLLLRALTGNVTVALFGQLLYPLLLTGFHYYAADSETPAVSLLPLFAYLVYTRRWGLSGLAAAVIVLLRVNLVPVVAAVALVGLVFRRESHARREALLLLVSTAVGLCFIFVVLAVRGEAHPYLDTLQQNVGYSSRALRFNQRPTGIAGHLLVVWQYMPTSAWIAFGAVVGPIAAAVLLCRGQRGRFLRADLTALAAASFLGTLIALAGTALLDHHLQLLAFPTLCGASVALSCTQIALRDSAGLSRWAGTVTVASCLLVPTILMTTPSVWKLRQWTVPPVTAVSDALYSAARRTAAPHSRISYFHFGGNDEMGSGAFLDSSFSLSCPRFHQYEFLTSGQLRQTMRCVRRSKPQLIAMTPSFVRRKLPPDFAAWNEFVRAGLRYVRSYCTVAVVSVNVRVYRCR